MKAQTDRNDRIVADYNAGLSLADCALRYGMTKQNVHRILKARPDMSLRPANGWTEKTERVRGERRDQGASAVPKRRAAETAGAQELTGGGQVDGQH